MIPGIKYVSNEQGEVTAVLLDLTVFQKEGILASNVLAELKDLQTLINKAPGSVKSKNWNDVRGELLKANLPDNKKL